MLISKKNIANGIIIFLVCILIRISFSQEYPPQFRHLTIENGLSQNSVQCIMQDRHGFIWLGTQDGLNRYDGYTFRIFKNDIADKNSLTNNYVWEIFEDSEGIIWIGTFGGGLNRFDPVTEKFSSYKTIQGDTKSISSNRVFVIKEFPRGILWIGTNDGLNRMDKSSGVIQRFYCRNNNNDATTGNFIGSISFSGDDFIWFSGDSGLTRLNVNDFTANHFKRSPLSGAEEIGVIYSINNVNGKLLLNCKAGLLEIDPEKKTDTLLLKSSDVLIGNKTPAFLKLLQIDENKYWIATGNGLINFNRATNQIRTFTNDPAKEYSLANNNILSLCRSADGITWVGTRNGLDLLYSDYSDFGSLVQIPGQESLSHKNVSGVTEDNFGNLWICTPDGLNIYNKTDNSFRVLKKGEDKNSLSSSYLLSITKSKDGTIWAGTRGGGLYSFDITGKNDFRMKHIQPESFDMKSTSIHFICEDDSGVIWLGTAGAGLLRYEPASNKIKQYLEGADGEKPGHPYVFTIMEDSFGNLWLGTASGGLNLFDRVKEKFIYFQHNQNNASSISNNIILCLYEDSKQNLWTGSSSGLNRLNFQLKKNMYDHFIGKGNLNNDSLFTVYGMKSGLPNEVIYGILEDKSARLWISTNKGLACFNPSERKNIKVYDINDGLVNNEYNQNGYYFSPLGEMYFGGVNGLNFFYPERLTYNKYAPPVKITGFRLYNENILTGVKNKHGLKLESAIHEIKELELEYHHDVLTFEYAALGYAGAEKTRYMYKMEGFDKDWVDAGNVRYATYTNLDAGNYVFRVKAANSDGVWNEEDTTIKLYIPPPPWLSWYAFSIYSVMFVLLGYVFIRKRIRAATRELEIKARIEKVKVEERENFRKEASRDFHDESGNRITRINLFTELARLQVEDKPQLADYLNKIEKNSNELSAGLRDFIWAVDPDKDTLFDTIMRLKEFGFSMFLDAGIEFKMDGLNPDFNNIKLPMQTKRSAILIFKEAMNNAVKYANAGKIYLAVSVYNNILEISLEDNGEGFDVDISGNQKGYGLNNMRERAEKAGGTLTIVSGVDKGTKIIFSCDIQHMSN